MTKAKLKTPRPEMEPDDMPEIDFSKRRFVRRGAGQARKLGLATLRVSRGFTQEEIAKRAGITQSEVSRAELRSDCLISTLERYAKALDGELSMFVKINGRSYPMALK